MARRGGHRPAFARASGAAVVILLALSRVSAAAAEETPAVERGPYDVVVLVAGGPGVPERVALSYGRLVEEERLRGAVQRLAAETGARVTGLVTSDEPLERGSQVRGTTVEFTAKGLLRPGGGPLPVAAFARALPEWRHMRLVFVVGGSFPFAGPESHAGDGFAVTLIADTDVYEYDVVRMKQGGAEPRAAVGKSAPAAEPGHQGDEPPMRGGASSRGAPIAAVVAVVVVSAAAWFAWWRSKRRSSGQSPEANASGPAAGGRGEHSL